MGRTFVADRRRGKLLLLDTSDDGPTLGLRFGMTGVLELDGVDAIDQLQYASHRKDPAWERFVVHFDGGTALRLRDPRRLGGVELDPDEERLGPDAASVGAAELGRILAGSDAPLKARLMDQARLAGLGNLLTDELLWRSGLDPARPGAIAGSGRAPASAPPPRPHPRRARREGRIPHGRPPGGPAPGSVCPRDGAPLQRRTIGGRTTYSCPAHQH